VENCRNGVSGVGTHRFIETMRVIGPRESVSFVPRSVR